ncbi:MAG: AMP-binding protein, partial [Oscillospiraceae bacterium]
MKDLHKKYCVEGYDEKGIINKFDIKCPDNFNFAFDIIDVIGKNEPDRRAMLWINEEGEEHSFKYSDLMKKSNQVANMLIAHGVKKGDKVLCVLKRHYQFWFATLALCKIGAVLIPATNQLMTKDFVYRFGAADVKYVIATAEGEVTAHVEEAMEQYDKIAERYIVNGDREGWVSFDSEMKKYPDTLARIE